MILLLAYLMRPVVGLIAVAVALGAIVAGAQEYAGIYAIPRAVVLWLFVACAATVFLLREQRS